MKITKVSDTWFIGRGRGVVFFGYSAQEVLTKHWHYMRSTSRRVYTLCPDRLAGKLMTVAAL